MGNRIVGRILDMNNSETCNTNAVKYTNVRSHFPLFLRTLEEHLKNLGSRGTLGTFPGVISNTAKRK